MPKAGNPTQTPSSPRSSGDTSSAEARVAHDRTSPRDTRAAPAALRNSLTEPKSPSRRPHNNGPASSEAFESWSADLDQRLVEIMAERPGCENEAIAAIKGSHPELQEDLIWARIKYLRLTTRRRTPYQRHEWTAEEDEMLRREYGKGRASSHEVIENILAMRPDWSRAAVIRRARALGVTQCRPDPYRTWTPALDRQLLSLRGCQTETIAKRLNCTRKAVLGRLRRLGMGADFFGGFKTKDLTRDLRVPETIVERWVRLGWLERKKGRITEESLQWLCRHHPEEIPFEALAPETRNWLVLSMGYRSNR
jgi:hypothetical protein